MPFAKTDGLYFDSTPEPQNREFTIAEDLCKEAEKEGTFVIWIGGKDAINYYDAKYQLMKDACGFKIKNSYHDGCLHIEKITEDSDIMI